MPSAVTLPALPQALLQDDALPLFLRIASRLVDDMRASEALAGDQLPSERALAERYGVSRDTLRAALSELQQRGVLISRAARGWFVGEPPEAPGADVPRQVPGFADYAAANGLVARTQVLSSGVRPSTVWEAEKLRVAPGSDLFELRRLRYLDGLIIASEHNRLPVHLCPELPRTDFNEASLYATLRSADPPQIPVVAEYSVEALTPSAEEQGLLQIDANIPLLVATQLAYNQDSRPLDLTVAAYRGDRYRFKATISNR